MRVLFLTIVKTSSLEDKGIYSDLLRKFRNEGHQVFIISPIERREGKSTYLKKEKGATLLQIKTLNLQKSNLVEKGIGTLLLEYQYLSAIKKYFSKEKFDLILYSTPPITFSRVIKYVKNRDQAYSYLLLKDIFPQNAIDMGLMKRSGLLHRFFRKKERLLYMESDTIGCMSPANKKYILSHNKYIPVTKVEVNPNSIEPLPVDENFERKLITREKHKLPKDAVIFVYGGNLGIPQGIDFLLKTIENNVRSDVFFLIVGSGREYKRIEQWFEDNNPLNSILIPAMSKNDYETLLEACDVGMIFLNPNFTIPNFPSRLLSYLEFKMPVIAATDSSTDIGEVIETAGCGYWVHSGDIQGMMEAISKMVSNKGDFALMKKKARLLLEKEFNVETSYHLIEEKLKTRSLKLVEG